MQTKNMIYKNFDLFRMYESMNNRMHTNVSSTTVSMPYKSKSEYDYSNLFGKYCMWDLINQNHDQSGDPQIYSFEKYTTTSSSTSASDLNRHFIRKARKDNLPQVQDKLKQILSMVQDGKLEPLKQWKKRNIGTLGNKSGRRSQYVGVSKNNQHWQVLINMGDSKKYIGTFGTQKQAAIAYDFYCIAIHSAKAKVNFTYSMELIAKMINSYFENEEYFDPRYFEDLVQ